MAAQDTLGTRRLAQLVRPIVWCRATDRIRDVARQISAADLSCALVRADGVLGIVTDHDFRHRVATGEVGLDQPIAALAAFPVLTIEAEATQSAALLRMLEHAVHHLVVTGPAGEPVGVVRAVDLAQPEVRDPLLIRSAIAAADTIDEVAAAARRLPATLVALHDDRVSPLHIGALHAAMVDAAVRRVLRLRSEPALAAERVSWVVLGSLARREPLPRSDLDTALVWADPDGPKDRPPDPAEIRAAAGRVLDDLRHCGFVPCPSGTNADNPVFSRAASAWRTASRDWQRDPAAGQGLLMSAVIADSRPLTQPMLGRSLTASLWPPNRHTRVLRALLDEALGFRPPTGFVRDFVVESSGEHRGQLDLKKGGLAPIVALARWLAIVGGEVSGNTPERLRRGADHGLLTADEAQTLTGAFEDIYALVLDHEVRALRGGDLPTTFVAPRDLDTLTRRHLRESFRAVRAIQARIDEHWLARLDRV
ncbi:putative nucleotidyltransferase substrate binding domain-containing protein [Natronosporangium hydrolyticum]|uniref:putative nucleotidyltransferase substrate binding domain-containing protein n=1 Tax=Natronosporangium hydrolyticum TaxID=2811111 RepID=UPI001EFA08FF|nr:putative nucleotidyltransferase substrate binding domain-containing protein [Natronosporangium hydrolyticum]